MRLINPDALMSEAEEDSADSFSGPQAAGLWRLYFLVFWLCASLLAGLILYPRYGPAALPTLAGWVAALGLTCLFTGRARIHLHDALVGLSDRDRLFLGLFILAVFVSPAIINGPAILPDGFLWALPLMLLISVRPPLARRTLAWMLGGAWFAALHIHTVGQTWLLPAFAVSWLAALGAAHFAFTGDPHGLSGWWPIRKALLGALVAAIPALLTGFLAWWLWPREQLAGPGPARKQGLEPSRLADRLDQLDLLELIWWGVAAIVITILTFVLLYYLRRFFLRHHKVTMDADVMAGQEARLEYRAAPPKKAARKLAGARGRIVELWGRWAAALEREGLGRGPGETANEYAERLARQFPDFTPAAAMTRLLERAHYSPDEPRPADVEAMRQHVAEELSRLSLYRQKPVESLDPEQ